jgi:hypothetical protein
MSAYIVPMFGLYILKGGVGGGGGGGGGEGVIASGAGEQGQLRLTHMAQSYQQSCMQPV